MFKKLVVIDAKGHLLGRLASYIAKALLSGITIIKQVNVLLLSELRVSISLDLSSEIKLNLLSSLEKDFLLILAELSFITDHHQEFSGELLEECFHISLLRELWLSAE